MRNSLHSCIYIFLIFQDRVTQVCFSLLRTCKVSLKCSRKWHCSIREKGKPNLCLRGQSLYRYINKDPQNICCSFSKVLSIMKIFSSAIHDSTQTNRKTIITTKSNIHSPFSVSCVTGLTLLTKTNDDHCKHRRWGLQAYCLFIIFNIWLCHKDCELPNWRIELAEIDIDRGLDFSI